MEAEGARAGEGAAALGRKEANLTAEREPPKFRTSAREGTVGRV